jgi:O-antigen/teichoic acid export membrane protein
VSPSLKEKTQWNYVREWLKGSTAYIYYCIGNQISAVFLIMLFVLGSQAARGDFEVASTIATIIAYSTVLSFALYPILLAKESQKDISSSLNLVLMFAISLTAITMAIPDSILTVLKASYAEATPVLFILAIDSLIWTIYSFYTYALFGVEKLDEKATVPIRQLVKSNIFKVFTLSYLYSAIILPATYYVLTNFKSANPVQPAVYVATITMMGHLVMLIVLFVLVRRTIKVIVPWISIGKYVFAGAIMGFVLYLIPHPTRLALVLVTCFMGGIIYLALLTVIDKETRTLFKSILQEVKILI